jgi:uncharacterized repeat protein (TIGR01451 family)
MAKSDVVGVHRHPILSKVMAIGAACATGGSVLIAGATNAFAAPAAPVPATIDCTTSTGFLSQGSPTQLHAEAFGSGAISFTPVGDTSAGITYNGISIDPANGYLYGIETSPNSDHLLRINPTTGAIEDLGATTPALSGSLIAGSFDSTGAHYYVSGSGSSMYDVDVVNGTSTGVTLSANSGLADYTVVGGYLWGLNSSATPVRIDPTTGTVTTFTALSGTSGSSGTYGAAFTLGNGDAEFGYNNGGVTEVRIDNPSAASPTFTVIANSSSPRATTNDGAACVSPPTHLSISASAPPAVAPNGTITWTVTVTNNGTSTSSGFVVSDTLPSGYTPDTGASSSGCSASGSNVTCTHGELDAGDTATILISATAPSSTSCGGAGATNSISVRGNEADSDPGAGDTAASPAICVTGDSSQAIDFVQPADALISAATATMAATADSGLTVGFTSTTPSVCTVSGTTVTLVAVGICTIHADQPGDADYQPAPTIVRSFVVSDDNGNSGTLATQSIDFPQPADVSISAATATLTATATSALTVEYTSTTPSICTVSGATVTLVARGVCTIDANQPGDSTYAAASTVHRAFSVIGRTQALTFAQPATTALADGTVTLTASTDSALAVGFASSTTDVCTVSGTTVTLVAAGICTIEATQPGDGSYLPAPALTRSFAVTDINGDSGTIAAQTITFPQPAATAVNGGSIQLSATSDAGLPVTYTSSTPAVCTVSGATVTVLAIGTCTINADQSGDATHAAASTVSATLAVVGAPQEIAVNQLPPIAVSTGSATVLATADSGLGLTYATSTPTVCTVASDGTVTLLTPGICTVAINQPGNGTFAAAPTITRSFPVTDINGDSGSIALQTLTFPDPGSTPLSTSTVTLAATSDAGLPVSYTSGTPLMCTVAGGTVTVLATGTCTIDADQPGDGTHSAASTATVSFAVTNSSGGGTPSNPPTTTVRVGGSTRDATAANVATTMYASAGSAHVVVLARDDIYADALTGSPLANALDGPLLITPTLQLSTDAQGAIAHVLPAGGVVICLGGTNAISQVVVTKLSGLGYTVQRIGGADRYETATLIANKIATTQTVSNAYLATGLNFADALPAADAAGLTHGVVLLTADSTMPSSTKTWIAQHSTVSTTAIGEAATKAAPTATSIVGADRYATAAEVASLVAATAPGVVLATGTAFPDGLSGAVFAVHNGWSLLLVNPQASALNAAQASYLHGISQSATTVTAIGGAAAIPDAAVALVSAGLH